MIYTDPNKRHDFVLIFDVTDGNPNGDPDGGNMPRTDPETMQGLVTDVALKRKVRNFIATVAADEDDAEKAGRLKIFIEHHGVLNDQIRRAYIEQGMNVGQAVREFIVKEGKSAADVEKLNQLIAGLKGVSSDLPSAFNFIDEDTDEQEPAVLEYSGELTPDELKSALDEIENLDKAVRKFVEATAKKSGKPDKNRANAEKARGWMTANFYDVRMFGAVMSTGLNAGQVRGPVQLTFARSIDPVLPKDYAVTRVAVTDAKDREKLQTIGRKAQIPYGLYVGYGFFSPHLASGVNGHKGSEVTESDLELFWQALIHMWSFDRSASRGLMAPRGLYIFSHENKLGNAPAHKLFERISVKSNTNGAPPRAFTDYIVTLDEAIPEDVTLTKLLEG